MFDEDLARLGLYSTKSHHVMTAGERVGPWTLPLMALFH